MFGLLSMISPTGIYVYITTGINQLHDMAVNVDDTLNELSPFALLSDSNDSYTMREMLRQPDKAEFIAAMGLEVNDHVTRNH